MLEYFNRCLSIYQDNLEQICQKISTGMLEEKPLKIKVKIYAENGMM